MAITVGAVTIKEKRSSQANFVTWATLALDASYPGTEGGYDLAAVLDVAGVIPGHEIIHVIVEPKLPYSFSWDRANNLLKVMKEDGTSGITALSGDHANLSGVTGLQATIWSQ